MCPAPKRMLLRTGVKAKMRQSRVASLTRSYLPDWLKRTVDTFAEKMNRTKQGRSVAGILIMKAPQIWADTSSPRPLSSDMNFGSEEVSPKSKTDWTNELIRVNAVSIPICSWVITLAKYVRPNMPIRVVNMVWRVRYIDPVATSEASIVLTLSFRSAFLDTFF